MCVHECVCVRLYTGGWHLIHSPHPQYSDHSHNRNCLTLHEIEPHTHSGYFFLIFRSSIPINYLTWEFRQCFGGIKQMLTLNASQKTQNMLLPAVEFLKTFRTFRIHDGPDCKHRLWWHWWRLIGCLHWNPIHCPVFTLPPSDSELYQAHPQWYYSWPAPNWFCKHFSCIAQKRDQIIWYRFCICENR